MALMKNTDPPITIIMIIMILYVVYLYIKR